ncbi:MAG: hypothetical protein H6730_28300 [Deltaproteobacteria bacterium]|nr:hypothetical protein [Deltaproteobacteria bacterium]
MNSLGGIGVQRQQVSPMMPKLSEQLEASKNKVKGVEARVAALVEPDPGLAKAWMNARFRREGREEAMLALVHEVDPISAQELREGFEETRRLSAAVESFRGLCKQLDAANERGEDKILGKFVGQQQKDARIQMLRDIDTVSRGIKAAGLCEAANKFPLAQLAALKDQVREQVEKLDAANLPQAPRLMSAAKVATLEGAVAAIADITGDKALAEGLKAAAGRADDKAAFTRDLGSFALLLDQASSAPDYSMTRMGWHYGYSRGDYRARAQQPFVMYLAEQRLEHSGEAAHAALSKVVDSKAPGLDLQEGLTKRFLDEIGVVPERAKGWKPSMDGIAKALAHEALVPLRALNETIQDMAGKHGHEGDFRRVVNELTQAMVEGNYKDWRNGNAASTRQLRPLSAAQKKAWLANDVRQSIDAPHGGRLTTREEDDVDLLWLTKIGGPSHGFDFGGHCLLPLLSNARTRAVVVEDTKWPDNPAARAYLRLLETKEGEPVLYLEPLQRDFPHRDTFQQDDLDGFFIAALVDHASKKAQALGVPLSIDARWGGIAKFLDLPTKADPKPEFVLAASAGVLEASDTMTTLHDWVQDKDMVIQPHNPRITYAPEGV